MLDMQLKTCRQCHQELAPEAFYLGKGNKRIARCKLCVSNNEKARRAANPEKYRAASRKNYYERGGALTDRLYRAALKQRDPEAYKARAKKATNKYRATIAGFFRLLCKTIKHRAKERGLEMALTAEFLISLYEKQNRRCALTGLPIEIQTGSGGICSTNPSVDRIDPARGYLPENIQLVQTRVNWMKSDLTMEELTELCQLILLRRE